MLTAGALNTPTTQAAEPTISFADVTATSGIAHVGNSWTASWGDVNGDGYPDLWANHHHDPEARPSLYVNDQDGTFTTRDDLHEIPPRNDLHGATWADVDNDGDDDLYQLRDRPGTFLAPQFLLMNDGGSLSNQIGGSGLENPAARGRTPLFFDYDRDGLLDVYLPTHIRRGESASESAPTGLFRQTPDGFVDVTAQVGLKETGRTHQFGQLADMNGDGVPELLTRVQAIFPHAVYDTTTVPFRDIRTSLGIPQLRATDAVVADFNNDLLPDIFVAGGEAPNDVSQISATTLQARLQPFNREVGFTFRSPGDLDVDLGFLFRLNQIGGAKAIHIGAAGWHPPAPGTSFHLTASDPQNHGIKSHQQGTNGIFIGYDPPSQTWTLLFSASGSGDLSFRIGSTSPITDVAAKGFANGVGSSNRLLINTGTGFQEDSSVAAEVNQSVNVAAGDFDNDRDLDLFVVNTRGGSNSPDAVYVNDGTGSFTRAPDTFGATGTTRGRGGNVAIADYDLDGALDVFTTAGRKPYFVGPYQLFRNTGTVGHWLQLDLHGTVSNADAVGAKVYVTAGGITQLREQNGGTHERGSQNFQRLHFGLGADTHIDEVRIVWPSGDVQTLIDVAADQVIGVTESGDGPGPGPDVTPPQSVVTTPDSGATLPAVPLTFTGEATDNAAVASVAVAIQDRQTRHWWRADGTWGAYQTHPATLTNPGAASTTWSYTWTPPSPGDYGVLTTARDTAGNRQHPKTWVPFQIEGSGGGGPGPDTTPPESTVTAPTAGQTLPAGPFTFTGEATDNVAVASVAVAIQDRQTRQWWRADGTWGAYQTHPAMLTSPGAASTTWSYTWTPTGSGDFGILTTAHDTAGNRQHPKTWVPFQV